MTYQLPTSSSLGADVWQNEEFSKTGKLKEDIFPMGICI